MEKRLSELTQAFQHLRFEQCIRMSDQMLKKMQKSQGKKKITMDQQDLRNMYLCRIGSFAALGHLHQANQLLNQKFQKPILSQQSSFLFLQICIMALDRRIPLHITAIADYKQKQKKNNLDINRFMLMNKNYSQLSRIFLKKFATQKKRNDSFTQIYLQYLQQLHLNNQISYKRDRIFKQIPKLDLRFVTMFLDKFVASFKEAEIPKDRVQYGQYLKIKNAIKQFKIRMAVNQGKSDVVRELVRELGDQVYGNIGKESNQVNEVKEGNEGKKAGNLNQAGHGIGDIFVYLRSLKAMKGQIQANQIIWRKQFLRIFRNNLNLDNYQPIYDYSIQFITHILTQPLKIPQNFTSTLTLQKIPYEQLYTFHQQPLPQIQNYLNSLYTEYFLLKQNQKQNKKKDYYKISVKNVLLLLLHILYQFKNLSTKQQGGSLSCVLGHLHEYLLIYKQEYGNKLTFPDQIGKYFGDLTVFNEEFKEKYKEGPIFFKKQDGNQQDKLIWLINFQRLYAKNPVGRTLQQNAKQWNRLHNMYRQNLQKVQHKRKLQKGQRYLSDQFLTIQSDSIRHYLLHSQTPQPHRAIHLILSHLQPAIALSPSNHDLKLRAIYFLNLLNYNQKCIQLLHSLDIKAVQYQTLGYLYFKTMFINDISSQQTLKKIIRSYQQVSKQCIQYSYKAILAISFSQCQQNISYYQNINNSYNFIIVLYSLYLRNRSKATCVYYLEEILYRVVECKKNGKKFSFNADFGVFKNSIEFGLGGEGKDQCFVDFYGVYNNVDIMELQCKIKLLLWEGNNNKQGKKQQKYSIQELRKNIKNICDLKQIYEFGKYQRFDGKITYNFKGNKSNELSTNNQLTAICLVYQLILSTYELLQFLNVPQSLQSIQKLSAQILGLSLNLTTFINKLSFTQQIRLLPQIRGHVSQVVVVLNNNLQIFVNANSGKKKKIENYGQIKNLIGEMIAKLMEGVSDGIKLEEEQVEEKEGWLGQGEKDMKNCKQTFMQRDSILRRVTAMTVNQFRKLYKLK